MRVAAFLFTILLNEVVAGGGKGKHHVHLKIHVPEIIKHHIHTKTVFIHVHTGGFGGGGKKKETPKKEAPKKMETHHEESHHDDWSSWSSYDHHDGHDEKHGGGHEHKPSAGKGSHHGSGHPMTMGHGGHTMPHGPMKAHYTFGHIQHQRPKDSPHQALIQSLNGGPSHLQIHDIHSQFFGKPADQLVPGQQVEYFGHNGPHGHKGQGLVGYSYPPQYSVHEQIKEVPHNDLETYSDAHEEGYHKGLHSETGHVYSDELKDFYDNKHEEGDFAEEGYQDESHDRHKGHYDLESEKLTMEKDHDNYKSQEDDAYLSRLKEIMDSR